jgi:hypothetical protein
MKQRFVLRYQGKGPPPERDVEAISNLADLQLISHTPRMLLVESDEEKLREVLHNLDHWIMSPETFLGHGDPRPRINS